MRNPFSKKKKAKANSSWLQEQHQEQKVEDVDQLISPLSGSGEQRKSISHYCMLTLCCIPVVIRKLHELGATPFVYNTDTVTEVRYEHYKATVGFTTIVSFATMAGLFAYGFNQEHQLWDGLDTVFHRIAAVVTLGMMAATMGLIGAGIHSGIQHWQDKRFKGTEEGQEMVRTSGGTRERTVRSERGALLGQHGKELKCHPAYACFPMTPKKTFGWLFLGTAAVMAIAFSIKPDFFNAIAESDYGHFGAVVTATTLATAVIDGAALSAQKLRSMGMDRFGCFGQCKERILPEYKAEEKSSYQSVSEFH